MNLVRKINCSDMGLFKGLHLSSHSLGDPRTVMRFLSDCTCSA